LFKNQIASLQFMGKIICTFAKIEKSPRVQGGHFEAPHKQSKYKLTQDIKKINPRLIANNWMLDASAVTNHNADLMSEPSVGFDSG